MFEQEPQRDQFEKVRLLGPSPGGGYSFETQRGDIYHGKPSLAGGHSPGDRLTVGYLSPGGMREPVILDGWAQTVVRYPKLASLPGSLRLTGLWTQWEGGPSLSLQPGLPGRQWVTGYTAAHVADQSVFSANLNTPQLWSSPVLWPTDAGMKMALLVITPQDASPGSTLALWLQIWGEFGGSAPYMFLLSSTLLANYYPALGAHGIALKPYDGNFDWGGEHLPSKLHYLPTTKQLLIFGPGWDDTGRVEAFLCDATTGAQLTRSILGALNFGASVSPGSIITAQWDNTKSVGQFTGILTESNPGYGACQIIGHKRNSANSYLPQWVKNPFSFVPSGAGIQILKPVSTKPSGRNDRRWPYSTGNNTVAMAISWGIGIDRSGGAETYNYTPPGSPGTDLRLTYPWAGAQTGCYSDVGITFVIHDADTGVEKFRHTISHDGHSNHQVESGTFGTGPSAGLPTVGDIAYGPGLSETIYQGFESLDRIDYHSHGDLPILFPMASYNAGKSLGSHGGTWTLLRENNGVGINYRDYYGTTSQWVVIGSQPGGPVFPSPLSGLGTPGSLQQHNSPGGTADTDDSYYFCFSLPWLITLFAALSSIGGAVVYNIENFDLPDGGGGFNTWVRSHSFSTAGSLQRFRTYLIKFQKSGSSYAVVGPVDISQYFGGIVVNDVGGAITPLTLEHEQPAHEQIWTDWIPVISTKANKIQNLLFAIRDIKDSLSTQSRPMLEVRDADTLALLGRIEIVPTDLADATDADSGYHEYTTAEDGQYLFETRAVGSPRLRASVCNTVPGKFGGGCAALTIWVYYQDRRLNSGSNPDPVPVTQRVLTLLFNGNYPSIAPTVVTTEQADYLATPNPDLPTVPDNWAQSTAAAYFGDGNVFSGGM